MILFLYSLAMYIDDLLVTFRNVRLYYSLVKLDVDAISTRGFNILNPAGRNSGYPHKNTWFGFEVDNLAIRYDLGSFNHGSCDCDSSFTLRVWISSKG